MSRGSQPEFDLPTPFRFRRLTNADIPALVRLSTRYPVRLLTLRLNVEVYGLEGPTVSGWGVFARDPDEMEGLLLRFNNTIVVVDGRGECALAFASIIDSETGLLGVRGTVETVRAIRPALSQYRVVDWEDSYFLRLQHPPKLPPELLALARRASESDLDRLTALYAGADTMYRSRANLAARLAESRVYVVEQAELYHRTGRIVSCALLNVEGEEAGLIGGVYTHPEARGKGYAAACTSALSIELQKNGKTPYLFYENPIAGRVYRRLGFEEVGQWAVLYINPKR